MVAFPTAPGLVPMALFRFCLGLALVLSVAACDSTEPVPGAILTVTARTASGDPAARVEVFATYGGLQPSAFRRVSSSVALDVARPYPNPARTLSTIRFTTSEAGDVRVSILNVAGIVQVVVLEESVAAGTFQVPVDVSDWRSGGCWVVVEGGIEVSERFLVTDFETPSEGGLALSLGRIDAQGRLVVTDSTRFPSLTDGPRRYIVVDDLGFELGEFAVDLEVGVVLQNAAGDSDGTTVVLRDGGTDVDLTIDP